MIERVIASATSALSRHPDRKERWIHQLRLALCFWFLVDLDRDRASVIASAMAVDFYLHHDSSDRKRLLSFLTESVSAAVEEVWEVRGQ